MIFFVGKANICNKHAAGEREDGEAGFLTHLSR
jgi:hypothetical protein